MISARTPGDASSRLALSSRWGHSRGHSGRDSVEKENAEWKTGHPNLDNGKRVCESFASSGSRLNTDVAAEESRRQAFGLTAFVSNWCGQSKKMERPEYEWGRYGRCEQLL